MVNVKILFYVTDWTETGPDEETTTMIKNNLLLSAFLLALPVIGCDGSKDDTGEPDTTDTDTTTDDSITPAEGEWYGGDEVIGKDTCNFGDDGKDTGGDDEPVTLTLTSDSTFTLTDDDKFNVSCSFETTGTFTCDDQSEVSDFTVHGVDAILTMTQSFGGTFTSSTEGTINLSISATCEGADCDFVSKQGGITLPCTTEMSLSISHGG